MESSSRQEARNSAQTDQASALEKERDGNKWSRSALSGWGVALAVSVVSAPAMHAYWFSTEESCRAPESVKQGEPPAHLALPMTSQKPNGLAQSAEVRRSSAELVKSIDLVPVAEAVPIEESVKSVGSTHVVEPVKSVEPVTEPVKSVEPVHVVEPVKSVEPTHVVEPVKPAEPVKSAEPVKPAEPVKAVDSVPVGGAVEAVEPVSAAEPSLPEAKSVDLDQSEKSQVERDGSAPDGHPSSPAVQAASTGLESMYHAGKKPIPISLDFKFTIQVGSFLHQEGALKRASDLRHKGYDAYILETRGKGGSDRLWQSVRLGRFQDRATAQKGLALYKRAEQDLTAFVAPNDSFSEEDEGNAAEQPKAAEASKAVEAPKAVEASKKAVEAPKKAVEAPKKAVEAPKKAVEAPDVAESPKAARAREESLQAPVSHASSVVEESRPSESMPSEPVSPEPVSSGPVPSEPVSPEPVSPAASSGVEPSGAKDLHAAISSQDMSAERLFQQSLAFRNNRDVNQEELLLRQTLQRDPEHGLARNRLARILVESRRNEESLQVLQVAAKGRSADRLSNEDPNLAAFLAALYQRQERHGQAVELYQTLLQRHPQKGIWRMGMAISLEKMGKSGEALTAYQESLADEGLSAKLRRFVQTRVDHLK